MFSWALLRRLDCRIMYMQALNSYDIPFLTSTISLSDATVPATHIRCYWYRSRELRLHLLHVTRE